MKAKLLHAAIHQLPDALGQLRAGEAVFGIARPPHDRIAGDEIPAGIEAAADFLGQTAVLLQKLDVRDVVQIDDGVQLARIFILSRRGFIG